MGYTREGHSSDLQWGQDVFSYSRILKGKKKIFEWGMVFCGALTGFAEIE